MSKRFKRLNWNLKPRFLGWWRLKINISSEISDQAPISYQQGSLQFLLCLSVSQNPNSKHNNLIITIWNFCMISWFNPVVTLTVFKKLYQLPSWNTLYAYLDGHFYTSILLQREVKQNSLTDQSQTRIDVNRLNSSPTIDQVNG